MAESTTIPAGIEIVAERTGGARVWKPEISGQAVYWLESSSRSSHREVLSKVLEELRPDEHEALKGKMAAWAEECVAMAKEHATHLVGATSLDEAVEEEFMRDPRVISDCMTLAAHLDRAARGEDEPRRW